MSASDLTAGGAGRGFNPWLAVGQILVVGTLWGTSFSLSKFAIGAGVPPLGYAFWQCFGAGITLLAVQRLRGGRMPLGRRYLGFYLLTGAFGIGAPNVNFYLVIGHIPAGLMAIVITTAPMITFLMALAAGLERFRWLRMVGILLGLVGVLLLVAPGAEGGGFNSWVLIGLLTPFFYAIGSICTAKFRPTGLTAPQAAAGMMLAAACLQFPFMLGLGQAYAPLPAPDWRDLAILTHVSVSTIAYITYFHLVRVAGPVYFSQVGYVVTLTGILWGMVFFGERLDHTIWIATGVLLAGIALVNLSGSGAKKT